MSAFERGAQRFWSRVDMTSGVDSCWEYTGPGVVIPSGHVRISFNGRHEYAHRVAARLLWGRYPDFCLHGCDNPRCCNAVNADHLHSASSLLTNVAEREARNRRTAFIRRGPDNPCSRLTHQDVACLVAERAKGVPVRLLAQRFGVSTVTVYTALKRASESVAA